MLLDNIEDNPEVREEFYRECYVPLEANNRHLLLSKKIIAARYKRVSDNGIEPAKTKPSVSRGRIQLDGGLLADASGSQPIVVIGDVGVGKTSFFENLYERLSQTQKKTTHYLHVNLGKKATLAHDIRAYLLSAIPEILKTSYGVNIQDASFVERVYADDLKDFDSSVSGRLKGIDQLEYEREKIRFLQGKIATADSHLHASLAYLVRSQNKQIVLVIDNADQRSFETQQRAFLIAQELAATRNVLVFVALRPSTFYQSKLMGALSGYKNRVLTISPPPPDEVLRKRIAFAVRVAEGEAAPAALEGVHLNIQSIVLFLRATLRSIRSNNRIKTFLGNITGGNTRLVIELITSFCGSPNVESERIVRIEKEQGGYQVPLHEFTKHALLGEYAYYNPLSSLVACNVFDVSAPDPREHFLSALIISYISSPMGIKDNDGFVDGTRIISEMLRLGFVEDQIRFQLRRLAIKRLVETPHAHYRELQVADDELPDQFHFRATSIGLYHIRFWVGAFSFLDATSIDTPIFDEKVRSSVFGRSSSLDIRDRFERATKFKKYLDLAWHEANFQMNYYDFPRVLVTEAESFRSVSDFVGITRKAPRSRSKGRSRQQSNRGR